MAFVHILIALDGAAMAQQVADGSLQPGTPAAPTSLGSFSQSSVYIVMVTQSSCIGNDSRGPSELSVTCAWGDTLRWNIQTFDGNMDHTAYLYGGNFGQPGSITPLVFLRTSGACYLPPASDPTDPPMLVENACYVAIGAAIGPIARLRYTLSFALVNNANGQTIGYFSWDPFIKVLVPVAR